MTVKKNKPPDLRGSPTSLSLQVKLTVRCNLNSLSDSLMSTIDGIMAPHGGEPYTEGMSLISGYADFIYDFDRVSDETKLMDDLENAISAALNYHWTLESFASSDAYPG